MMNRGATNGGATADRGRGPVLTDRLLETLAARLALTLAQPLGGVLVQPVLDLMMATLRRRHPSGFERLAELGEAALLIEPTDLPAAFRLQVGTKPGLRVSAPGQEPARAKIRGSFAVLLDLFEGRIDGDALFFSRELSIEGDTELVVGLRNALDGEEFDLAADFGALLGPLSVLPVRRPLQRLAGTLLDLHEVLLAPALRRLDQVERRLGRLEEGKR
jgi:predicted lipid carrier protein YhbT